MHSPAEAEKIILEHVPVLPAEDCPLGQAHGRVLRSPIIADRDLPPYDRVTMDGYALQLPSSDGGKRDNSVTGSYKVIGMQAAGMVPMAIHAGDECIEIATGAILPRGANTVVPYEDTVQTNPDDPERAGDSRTKATKLIFLDKKHAPTVGQFIHKRGSDHKKGDVLCEAGVRLSSREIAAAASCGYTYLRVSALPRIAIVTTGDELVDVSHQSPAPHQIRRSNDYALRAALIESGYPHVECFQLRDLEHEIEAHLKQILAKNDVVIITGGVSKGRFDFVPQVLARLGVEKKVQGISQRPGKPMWFGITPRVTPIFALPGNPVSTYICFHRYVLSALAQMGKEAPLPVQVLKLPQNDSVSIGGFTAVANSKAMSLSAAAPALLTRYVVVRQTSTDKFGARLSDVMDVNTSGDFTALIGSDGFVEIPPTQQHATAQQNSNTELMRFFPWR